MMDAAESTTAAWHVMVDGAVFGTYNRQGGPRGETDVRSQNWLMGMASRPLAAGTLTLSGMLSLEPATIGGRGYSEIFQHGEAYRGLPVNDRQHPHDALMQLSALWQRPLGSRVGLTFAGGLVGSPAFGPPAFMHRPSASEMPLASLSHHTFDSTHITMGVLTAGLDVKPFQFLASVFRGAEPDDRRWDLDLGALDSASAQVWWRPTPAWAIQGSYAFLHEPEQLEPGNQRRSSASIGWMKDRGNGRFTALTLAGGQVVRPFNTTRSLLGELTHHVGQNIVFARYDGVGLETEHLLFPTTVHQPHPGELIDPLLAYTVGAARTVATVRGFPLAVGTQVTAYTVPDRLRATHGSRPLSVQVFVRLRPPMPSMGRMWNMIMTSGMPTQGMAGMDHSRMEH